MNKTVIKNGSVSGGWVNIDYDKWVEIELENLYPEIKKGKK